MFVLSFENEDDRTFYSRHYVPNVQIKYLLDYEYFLRHCKLIAINLSKKIQLENPDLKQQVNFIGKLERNEGPTMCLIIKKSEETIFEFSQNSATVV